MMSFTEWYHILAPSVLLNLKRIDRGVHPCAQVNLQSDVKSKRFHCAFLAHGPSAVQQRDVALETNNGFFSEWLRHKYLRIDFVMCDVHNPSGVKTPSWNAKLRTSPEPWSGLWKICTSPFLGLHLAAVPGPRFYATTSQDRKQPSKGTKLNSILQRRHRFGKIFCCGAP